MRPLEKLVASDGYEVALFPLEYMNMSQDEGGDYSHSGTYNLDFLGWDRYGRVYNCSIYAPCTMKVVDTYLTYAGGNMVVFESVERVHLADGTLDYLCITLAHANNPPVTTLGTIVSQGTLCYRTGTYGDVTGDHVHSCLGKGHYQGLVDRGDNRYDLVNRIHYWEGVYVNDTVIIEGYNHNWLEYHGGIIPTLTPKEHKFKWVLYANKFRDRTNA